MYITHQTLFPILFVVHHTVSMAFITTKNTSRFHSSCDSTNEQQYVFTYKNYLLQQCYDTAYSYRRARTFVASVTVNSPALSSIITVSMVSSFAIMTKRCAETHPRIDRYVRDRKRHVNQGRKMYTLARGPPRTGLASKTRPRPETKSA
jgi:hypothetical protein